MLTLAWQILEIRKYIEESSVPHTYIDIGLWYQLTVPYRGAVKGPIPELVREFCGDGEKKTAMVNKDGMGLYVAQIIADPRTLNQYVFIYDDVRTMNEIYEVAGCIAGEDFHKIKVVVRPHPPLNLSSTESVFLTFLMHLGQRRRGPQAREP
jgi:hypothetical protein